MFICIITCKTSKTPKKKYTFFKIVEIIPKTKIYKFAIDVIPFYKIDFFFKEKKRNP